MGGNGRPPRMPLARNSSITGCTVRPSRLTIKKLVCDSLEVARKADVLVLDTLRAHLVPAGRIVSAWIHNGQPSDIESVMIDGQFVMRPAITIQARSRD